MDYNDNSLTDSDAEQEGDGMSIIFGTLDFENKDRKSNLGDDSGSVGTMGYKAPVGFINDPDQQAQNEEGETRTGEAGDSDMDLEENEETTTQDSGDMADSALIHRVLQDERMLEILREALANPKTATLKQGDSGGDS